jgi:hypothetical protein
MKLNEHKGRFTTMKIVKSRAILGIFLGIFALPTLASLVTLDDLTDTGLVAPGPGPDPMGGYDMTFVPVAGSAGDMVNTIDLTGLGTLSGSIDFQNRNGTDWVDDGNPLNMQIQDPQSPDWWNGHDMIYATDQHWVEIILPEHTTAFSFFVGASFNGIGWWQAFDGDGNAAFTNSYGDPDKSGTFTLGPGNTRGFGVYNDDAAGCGTVSRIIIEPYNWGVGDFSISQNSSCGVGVPEPSNNALLVLGLVGILLGRRLSKQQIV